MLFVFFIVIVRAFVTELSQISSFSLLISSELWLSGYDDGLVIWRPCGVGGLNPTVDKIFFCNVHLFRVPCR